MIKKILLTLFCLITLFNVSCSAKTSEPVDYIGKQKINGWVVCDMTVNDGVVSRNAVYSMQLFNDFGLVPVALCLSGGSRMGTYHTFFVNPYNNCLIIGRKTLAFHDDIFYNDSESTSLSGLMVYYTDMRKGQELYRKIIDVAKEEFAKYQK